MILNSLIKILKIGYQRGKNIVVLVLILIIFAHLFAFLDPTVAKNQWSLGIFKAKIAFAQFFFPRYPERLKYVIGELNQASEQLVYFNQELKNLTGQCNCKNANSQCGQQSTLGAPSKKNVELNPLDFKLDMLNPEKTIATAGNEINRARNQVVDSINSLNIYLIIAKQKKEVSGSLDAKIKEVFKFLGVTLGVNIAEETSEKYKQEMEKIVKDITTKVTFDPSEIIKMENQLQDFTNLNDTLKNEENKLKGLQGELKELLKIKDELKRKIDGISELPDQLKDKLNQITEDLKQQITKLPDSIKSLLSPNACKTVSPDVFGETCPSRKDIEEKQIGIKNKIDQVSYLRELLTKEMESGLEAELKTLREDEANQLRNSLNDIMTSSNDIIPPAQANIAILNDEQYSAEKQCRPDCERGFSFNLMACILENLGEQNPINLIFEVGAALKEIDLGEIGIKEIGLNLPEKLELGGAGGIKDFKIPLPDLEIDFPTMTTGELENLSLNPIVFHPPSPSLPTFPWANLSCPKLTSQTYQCQPEEQGSPAGYTEFEWYLQTFSWLSEKCQEIPGLKDQYGMPDNKCFDKENIYLTIILQCDILWQEYLNCINIPFAECTPPPGICGSLGNPGTRQVSQQRECQNLFKQRGETIPQNCDLNTLKNKCAQLKEEGQEEVPDPCKFLPLFTKLFEEPRSQQYQGKTTSCPSQTILDNPGGGIRLDCPLSTAGLLSAIPKIKLPDIIIPDIRMPSFSFMPFLKVKLPNFIFEDLILSDLELCNLDDCLALIPPLDIQFPTLRIPTIDIPALYPEFPKVPGLPEIPFPLKVEMDNIEFPSIPIPLPQLDLANLLSLKLQLPEIPIPFPEILLNLKGLDINVMNLLLGLVSKIIPIPSGCIGVGIDFIPLVIGFPDYYFYWPRFPEIPDLCNNKYVNVNTFCQDMKKTLDNKEVVDKIKKIQDTINKAVQNQVQKRLDEIALLYKETVEEEINKNLEKIKSKIEAELEKVIARTTVKNEVIEIPTAKIPLDDINIPMEKINKYLAKIPLEVKIPWPEELKEIKLSEPITYQLPPIPLEDLSYTKEIPLELPGFQFPSLEFSIDFLGNYPSCEGQDPSGGNPYPVNKINVNLGEIIKINEEINKTRESISQVLR